jgi:hypothetical protein
MGVFALVGTQGMLPAGCNIFNNFSDLWCMALAGAGGAGGAVASTANWPASAMKARPMKTITAPTAPELATASTPIARRASRSPPPRRLEHEGRLDASTAIGVVAFPPPALPGRRGEAKHVEVPTASMRRY